MTEPIEKITDETVIGGVSGPLDVIEVDVFHLHEPYRNMLLTSAEKDKEIEHFKEDQAHSVKLLNELAEQIETQSAKIKEMEEKLKEALETLEELKWCYHNASSGKRGVEAVRDCVDLVEKLKAE